MGLGSATSHGGVRGVSPTNILSFACLLMTQDALQPGSQVLYSLLSACNVKMHDCSPDIWQV